MDAAEVPAAGPVGRGGVRRVLVVEDHPLMQAAIIGLLQRVAPAAGVAACCSVADALARIAAEDGIDAAVVDLHLPDGSGEQVVRAMNGRGPVLVLSASEEPADAKRVLACGARGYCTKAASPETLSEAMMRVLDGGVYLPPLVWQARTALAGPLTQRQLAVLRRLADGLQNKRIAAELGIAEQTVKVHIGAIFRALGACNRTQAARAAREAGLLDD